MAPKKNKGIFTYFLVVILALICVYYVMSKISDSAAKTEYTQVIQHFDNYEVSYYDLDLGTGELTYQLRGEEKTRKYKVPNVDIFYHDTEDYRIEYNKKYPDEPLEQDYQRINTDAPSPSNKKKKEN